MDVEKLIEQLNDWNEKYISNLCGDRTIKCEEYCIKDDCLIVKAATALEQLQAENDRLRREKDEALRLLKRFAPCAGCKWYRGIKGCGHEIGCDPGNDRYEFVVKGGNEHGTVDQKGSWSVDCLM